MATIAVVGVIGIGLGAFIFGGVALTISFIKESGWLAFGGVFVLAVWFAAALLDVTGVRNRR